MSAPSKTSRLGRGTYRRPSADVLDELTDPGPPTPIALPVTSDDAVVEDSPVVPDTSDTWVAPVVSVTRDAPGSSVVSDTGGYPGTQDVAGFSGVSDVWVADGDLGTPDNSRNSDDSGPSGTADVGGTAGTSKNSSSRDNSDVSHSVGSRPRRAAAKPRAAVPEVEVSGNRGTSDTPRARPAATPRDHVKVARPLVDEMRDAVWFLSEHGRPRVQLGELIDEAIGAWLKAAKADHNGGKAFPVKGRLR